MKRLISYLLAAVLVISMMACGVGTAFADESAAVTIETSDIDLQLSLLYTQISKLKQDSGENTWYYTVTDLDHDGNLEFAAATLHPQDRSTNLKVWELGADRQTLTECTLDMEEDESFPDIMTDVADTYHDTETDTWFYLFYDNVVISDSEVYTVKTAVDLKDGVIGYDAYAVQHVVANNANRTVSYTDANGFAISPEQYNAAGSNAFAGMERTSTNFEWLTESDLSSFTRLLDSYAVFSGTKEPTEVFPVPRPAALQDAAAAPVPAAKPAEEVKYLAVTKNPTNENRKAGETALFVACANAYESLSWTLVSPNGGEYSVPNFRSYFGANVTGEYSTTLSVAKLTADMNGWGAYCTFYYKGQTQRTTTAYMYVKGEQIPESGSLDGYVTEIVRNSVTIEVPGVDYFTLDLSICTINGDLDVGAPATVYYNGRGARGVNVTGAVIHGSTTPDVPESGSLDGYVTEFVRNSITIEVPGVDYFTLDLGNCTVEGELYVGAPATVYYSGRGARGVNATGAIIHGSGTPEPAPQPQGGVYYGSVDDWTYDYVRVNLDGTNVVGLPWDICTVNGDIYAGAPAAVTWSESADKAVTYTSCVITGQEPQGGVYYGSVDDWTYDYVRVNLDGTNVVGLPWSICDVSGDIYVGAPAAVEWTDTAASGLTYNRCTITGREPAPAPVYGSMSGTAYEGGGGYAIYLADGTEVYVDGWKCSVSGTFYDGASCTVYYTEPVSGDSIYQVEIYGSTYVEPEPAVEPAYEPYYGSLDGTAFQDFGDMMVVYLDNGNTLYLADHSSEGFELVLHGELVMAGGGNPCRVYYVDEPVEWNVYKVEVFQAEDS